MPVPVTRNNQAAPLLTIRCISPIGETLIPTQKNAYPWPPSHAASWLSRNGDDLIKYRTSRRWRRPTSVLNSKSCIQVSTRWALHPDAEWHSERTSECLPETVNSACSGSMRPSASRTASNRDAVSGSQTMGLCSTVTQPRLSNADSFVGIRKHSPGMKQVIGSQSDTGGPTSDLSRVRPAVGRLLRRHGS
ncbi:hypothetical protein HDE78_000552 [Rhodanobacter sp. K2T2]|nr:hypothetical protein [Rhodanobacter sp. K2T2]